MYLIIAEVNRKVLGKEMADNVAFKRITEFYEHNHGHKPEGIE